jgi:hypothetical protein
MSPTAGLVVVNRNIPAPDYPVIRSTVITIEVPYGNNEKWSSTRTDGMIYMIV